MKKIFVLSMLISFAMICSCQKQDTAAEQQLAQRKAELDERENAKDSVDWNNYKDRGCLPGQHLLRRRLRRHLRWQHLLRRRLLPQVRRPRRNKIRGANHGCLVKIGRQIRALLCEVARVLEHVDGN